MPLKNRFIHVPDRGVSRILQSHQLDERQWRSLDWVRTGRGRLERVPGYSNLITSGSPLSTQVTLFARYRKSDDTEYHVIGDITDLYEYNPSLGSLTSRSSSLAAFSQSMDYPWASCIFNDTLYVNAYNQGLYKWTGAGDFVAVGSQSFPAGAIIGFKNHLHAARRGSGGDPVTSYWASEASDTIWNAASGNDAGSIPLAEYGDPPVRYLLLGPDLCVLYGKRMTGVITYVGGAAVFAFTIISRQVGAAGPFAVADLGDRHFLVSHQDFYLFDGSGFKPIGGPIRDAFYTECNRNYLDRIRVMFDRNLKLVYVFFVSSSMTAALGFFPDKMYIYDITEDQWYGPTSLTHYPTAVSDLTGEYITVIDSITDVIDSVALMIDDLHAWTRVGPVAVFGANTGALYGFDEAVLTGAGSTLSRQAISGDHYIGRPVLDQLGRIVDSPNRYFYINRLHYEVGDDDTSGSISIYVAVRTHLNEAISYSGPYTITLGTSDSNKGHIDVRLGPARWVRWKVEGTSRIGLSAYGWDYREGGTR